MPTLLGFLLLAARSLRLHLGVERLIECGSKPVLCVPDHSTLTVVLESDPAVCVL